MFKKDIFIKIIKWIPAIFITGVSIYLSSQETIEHFPSFWNADKLVHFICFAGLCFWVSFGCNIKSFKFFWIPVVITSVYGIIDEIHQSFTPGRSCSIFDWMADTTGALLGATVFVLIYKLFKKYFFKQDENSYSRDRDKNK